MIRQRHHTNCNDGAIAEQSCWPAIPTQHGSIVLNYNSLMRGCMGDEDANFHGVVVALAIVIVVAGLIEIVRFFISLFL